MAALTAVLYNGKRLIPAPKMSFNRNHRRSGDQSIIGTEHSVSISGQFVGCKGWDFSSGSPEFYTGNDYPADDSTCDKFTNLVEMQKKVRELFDIDGDYHWFEVIGCDGLIRKWRARILSVDIPEGTWTDIVEYNVTLGLQTDEAEDEDLHIDHTENWEVQFDEESGGIFTLSHTLSCSSEEFAETELNIKDGWEQAKDWIDTRLGGADYTGDAPSNIKNDIITNGVGVSLDNYTAYNYTVQRSVDEYSGVYSVSETWLLAKHPVFRQWNLSFSRPRDEYAGVTIEGEFRSFLDRTTSTESSPTNGTASLDAFIIWNNSGAPYAEASAFYTASGGTETLGDCPVNSSVTKAVESRGDGTQTFGEQARTVQFSYEFSDSDPDSELSLTKSVQEKNTETCETTVSVSGSIQGHKCTAGETKLGNAQTRYATIDCQTEAEAAYTAWGGDGSLVLISRSYTENEQTGTIEFSCEFTDQYEDGVIKDEKIVIGWTCGELKSDEESKTTYTVEGTLRGACDGDMPTAPDPSTYFTCEDEDCCTLRRRSITQDETNKIVNYTFEYDNDCGPGLVEISVTKQQGPEDCENWTTDVEFSVQGIGCKSIDMYNNALLALQGLDAVDYAVGNSYQTSYRRQENQTRGTITDSYSFTTDGTATITVTITESYDRGDCEDMKYQVEGEIKGNCFAEDGAMQAAEDLFIDHSAAIYGETYGCLESSSISRTEKDGTIRFSYSYSDCEDGYEHEQTVSTRTDDQDCCLDVTISGTIIPYCEPETGESGAVLKGLEAWAIVEPTLLALAQAECDAATAILRSTQVSKNKKNGQIQYSHTYQCCESGIFTGALKESINITHDYPSNLVAIVPIIGRTCGPIIQDKGSKTIEKCSVAIDLVFQKQCSTLTKPSGLEAQVQGIISDAGCCSDAYGTYTERDTESWNPRSGRYTRNVTFLCECC